VSGQRSTRVRGGMRQGSSRLIGRAANAAARVSARLASGGPDLQGDRTVEWSYCMARLANGPSTTLDFGPGESPLSLCAAQRGHDVVALDRMPLTFLYMHERITFLHADILDHSLEGRRFDQIINCSSVEHVGLGGRYGSPDRPEGDLEAMTVMHSLLAPEGRMILTIPVGRDMVCAPHHRIYGEDRLPRLLGPYTPIEEQYWRKDLAHGWSQTSRSTALATEGSESFYSLGLFVLAPGTG
jgi:SAM-dependent methyltransferase